MPTKSTPRTPRSPRSPTSPKNLILDTAATPVVDIRAMRTTKDVVAANAATSGTASEGVVSGIGGEVVKPSDMMDENGYRYEEEEDDGDDDADEAGDTPERQLNTRFKDENAMLRVRTSSEMLELATASVDANQAKIASFIDSMKSGDVKQTKDVSGSGFRARRLTSAIKVDERNAPAEQRKRSSTFRAARTTIYASTEIGVRQERRPPFPPEILGTFSCHGIEPDEHSLEGVQQKINQDRGCVVYPFNSKTTEALFMVLDGHGEQGDRVAEFAMRQIVVSLEKHPTLNTDVTRAFKESFVTTNTALMVTPIKYMTAGSTVVAVLVRGNTFYVANVGDSRAVVAVADCGSVRAKMLSRDHKPDDSEEIKRITEWGGFVSPSPEPGVSARVWLDKAFTMIGLAMSRSIGDHAVKNIGVVPEPDVFTHELTEDDKFMILASDGVWEFIENQEAVEIVAANLHLGAFVACQVLIQTAAKRWAEEEGDYRDDITAIVIVLPLPSQSIGASAVAQVTASVDTKEGESSS